MLCETGTERDLAKAGYAAELKIDGTRAVIIKKGRNVKIQNRHGIIYTARLPELADSALKLPKDCVIDGEIVCVDGYGKFDFVNTQRRCSTQDLGKVFFLKRRYPVNFFAFDVLSIDGENLRQWQYAMRKLELRKLIPRFRTSNIHYLEHRFDLEEFYEKVKRFSGEGIVLKKVDSPYQHRRSLYWLKVKVWKTETLSVAGWLQSAKGRQFRSLVLAKDGKHVGEVGSGFNYADLWQISKTLKACREIPRPFEIDKPFIAIDSDLKVEVKFLQWTKGGKLRHPVFLRVVK